jgi:hypothetical protein
MREEVTCLMPGTRVRPAAGPGMNLVPGIRDFDMKEDVDGRDKLGHDEVLV